MILGAIDVGTSDVGIVVEPGRIVPVGLGKSEGKVTVGLGKSEG